MGKHHLIKRRLTINCILCGSPKPFWKIVGIDASENSELKYVGYACGACYDRLERKLLKKNPAMSVRREKITVIDFAEHEMSERNTRIMEKGGKPIYGYY